MDLERFIPDDPMVRAAAFVALAALAVLVVVHRAFPVPR